MKRIISLMLMVLPLSAMAQIPEFSKLMTEYSTHENVTVINIDKNLIGMMGADIEGVENVELIEVVMTEDKGLGDKITSATHKIAKKHDAKVMVSHMSTEDNITVYTLGNDDEVTHIILVIGAEDTYGAAVITGNIAVKDIAKLIHVQM